MLIDKLIFKKHLEVGEVILYSVHKHWITILKPTLEVAFFGILLPWGLFFAGFNTNIFFWIVIFWSLLAYSRFLYILFDWYYDAWLITNMSVITIEWRGIFNNTAARSSYEDIEGATYVIAGFFSTVMRFGDMTLRLMSGSNFEMEKAAKPKKAELALARFQGQFMNDRNMSDSDSLKNLLSDLVSHHVRKR